ncbi:MAG: tetratricopeptide repeat protein [Solirubrobacterales bacterium]
MAKKVLLPVLLSLALFALWGCDEGARPVQTTISPAPTMASDVTESQLLAELDKKFENPQAHYELARLYHRSQNWNKAEYRYNVALGFQPGFKAAQAGLVKMYIDSGETAKAEQFASRFIGLSSGAISETLRLGWEFEQLGLDVYALRCYRQALGAAPDSPEANRQIGYYYLNKGDNTQAKQYLMRSFELNPRQPDVAGALGKLGIVVEAPADAQPQVPSTAPAQPK